MTNHDDIRTIQATNEFLRTLVETPETIDDNFWLTGVVTHRFQSHLGHTYFTIKDRQHSISCMLPNRYKDKAVYVAKDVLIDVYGAIRVYEKEAKLQFMASDVRAVELDENSIDYNVLEELKTQGLYPKEKQDLPQFPRHISLITSRRSEAVNDFKYAYKEQNGTANLVVLDTLVQGEQAPQMIANRIEEANMNDETDIIVITRGGGRTEDLKVFNSFDVASAICKSQIPVVTGIGHQRDETTADRVADQKTISPTDAAYKLAKLSHGATDTVPEPVQEQQQAQQSYMLVIFVAIAILAMGIILFVLLGQS